MDSGTVRDVRGVHKPVPTHSHPPGDRYVHVSLVDGYKDVVPANSSSPKFAFMHHFKNKPINPLNKAAHKMTTRLVNKARRHYVRSDGAVIKE